MLTGKMVRVRYSRDQIVPQYLDVQDPQWLLVAEQLLGIFRTHTSPTRGQLDEEIESLFGDLPQPQIHQGLAKLLEDRCEFQVQSALPPEQVREALFSAATRQRRKLMEELGRVFSRAEIVEEVAKKLPAEVTEIEASMFADLKSEQRLMQFRDTTPERLLERYNVALAQSILLRSTGVEILVRGETPQHYRQLFGQVKFRRLICDVQLVKAKTYRLRLDGPLSMFNATQKYGLQLALFLPTLLLCSDFELRAKLCWGAGREDKGFHLSSKQGLVSHQAEVGVYVPPEVPMFIETFQRKITEWKITEESDIIPVGKSFWIPDYRLTHVRTGKYVLLDILGFWKRSSVERHLALLREHVGLPFVLALSDQLNVEEEALEGLPANVVRFRNMPLVDEVAKRAFQVLFR